MKIITIKIKTNRVMMDILPTLKNTPRKPYIYKVTSRETGQYYIGSQCSGKTIGVDYYTSSRNKEFKEDFKNYGGEKYEITIVKEFSDPKKCIKIENYIIRNFMQLKDGLCLNRSYFCKNKKIFSRIGIHHSEEHKKKLSTTLKGHHVSEEAKQKMSLASRSRIKISIEGTVFSSMNEASKYYNVTQPTISYWFKTKKHNASLIEGIPFSEEHKKKLSEAASRSRIKISIEGTVFSSMNEASKYYNVTKQAIRKWVKNKKHNAVYSKK